MYQGINTLPLLITDEIGGVPAGRGGGKFYDQRFLSFLALLLRDLNMVIDKDFIAKIYVYPYRFSTEPFFQLREV